MKEFLMSPVFLSGLAYVIVLPIFVYGIARLQKWLMIDRVAQKTRNRADLENLPKPAWGIWVQRISFTKSDKRSVTIGKKALNIERRILFFGLYLSGLVAVIAGVFLKILPLAFLGIVLFFASVTFGIKSSKALMSERERIMNRMLEVGRAKLGLGANARINEDVKVLEWQDFTSPQKVQYTVPTTFSDVGAESFLQQFNQVFGNAQEWVASKEDGGWDYDKGLVVLAAVPPLPTIANWAEHYVLSEGVADSFFPIGISVQGGIELMNPETGEMENVIGFDVGGKQAGEGKKAGLNVDGSLGSASPQVLAAGATGSGKSLALDTPIAVYKPLI